MNATTEPIVSIVMCVHNGAGFLPAMLASMAAQTLRDYEFIIVDDASTDATPQLLADAAAADRRLKVHRVHENLGLTKALNIGLSMASGRYVARIDADDVSVSERLQAQHDFLEAHPDHVAVGCGYRVIDANNRLVRTVAVPLDDWQVRWLCGFNPPAPHPAFFYRRLQMNGESWFYDPAYTTAQDFELWNRMLAQGKIAAIGDILLEYRRHDGAITVRKRREQAANCRKIGMASLRRRLPIEIVEALEPFYEVFSYDRAADCETIRLVTRGFDMLLGHDLPNAPSAMHRRWLRRTAAGLIADCLLSRGAALRSPIMTLAFIFYAYRHLPALVSAVILMPGIAMKSLAALNRIVPGTAESSSS